MAAGASREQILRRRRQLADRLIEFNAAPPGARVAFWFWGERRTGVVERIGAGGIVYVRDDGNGRLRWLHATSVDRGN